MNAIGKDIWIFDGPEIRFLGLTIPTRMTIICCDGDLWVHSPIPITPEIQAFIKRQGSVVDVVAPNNLHHLYLLDWQERFPNARYVAAPGLRDKRPELRFDDDLQPNNQHDWTPLISHAHFLGNRYLEEVVFFHHASKTLILTDLILNLRIDNFGWLQKQFARFDGIGFPEGGTPRLFRWSMRDRALAKPCYQIMIDWEPEQIVISHGECFFDNAAAELKRRFAWVST